jgi:hypothetical protein
MNRKTLIISGAIAALALILIAAQTFWNNDLAKIRRATAQFHRTEAAKAAGYDLRAGLDNCFDNPGVGGMGFHYINTDILDTQVDLLHPEAMVYAPGPNGQLELGAVEYIVPQDKWDATGSTEPPMLNGMHLHLNNDLHVYVMHAWVWKNNPRGVWEDWNPNVSCPK